jgi:hypothetical protein
MSEPTLADFKTRFPELTTTASEDAWVTLRLPDDYRRCSAGVWGVDRAEGAMLASAHRLFIQRKLVEKSIGAGSKRSKSAGGWSKQYASAPAGSTKWYDLSPYGSEYRMLLRPRVALMSRVSL